jgi:hypothetical protein
MMRGLYPKRRGAVNGRLRAPPLVRNLRQLRGLCFGSPAGQGGLRNMVPRRDPEAWSRETGRGAGRS